MGSLTGLEKAKFLKDYFTIIGSSYAIWFNIVYITGGTYFGLTSLIPLIVLTLCSLLMILPLFGFICFSNIETYILNCSFKKILFSCGILLSLAGAVGVVYTFIYAPYEFVPVVINLLLVLSSVFMLTRYDSHVKANNNGKVPYDDIDISNNVKNSV